MFVANNIHEILRLSLDFVVKIIKTFTGNSKTKKGYKISLKIKNIP